MSSDVLIPTPEEFRVFCEFAFESDARDVQVFYTCCTQCGLDHLNELKSEHKVYWLFATTDDLQHAGDKGELLFHFGFSHGTELEADRETGHYIVQALESQGLDVRWDGDPNTRIIVKVDRQSYGRLSRHVQEEVMGKKPVPAHAISIDSPISGYQIRIWPDSHSRWWFDISTPEEGTLERDHCESRELAMAEAIALVQEIYLDIN